MGACSFSLQIIASSESVKPHVNSQIMFKKYKTNMFSNCWNEDSNACLTNDAWIPFNTQKRDIT
jgi:hypothetical protein